MLKSQSNSAVTKRCCILTLRLDVHPFYGYFPPTMKNANDHESYKTKGNTKSKAVAFRMRKQKRKTYFCKQEVPQKGE